MKKIFNRVLIVMLMLTFTMTSCSDDDELIQGTGVSEALWENENEAIIEGETIEDSVGCSGRIFTAINYRKKRRNGSPCSDHNPSSIRFC